MSVTGNANIIADFGVDPTSATGAFQHSLGSLNGTFDDQYTFSLDHTLTLTIASVTNVFASTSDIITGLTGEVVAGTPATPGSVMIGPLTATQPCGIVPNCQGFAGSAILGPGSYFLDISGSAGGTSGYGGNLATAAVPGPIVGAGIPGLVASFLGGGWFWRRRKQAA